MDSTEKNVVNKNDKYYLAIVNVVDNTCVIRTNSKASREYFKTLYNDDCKVFKLRGQNVEEVFNNLKEHLDMDLKIVNQRNKKTMPTVMPIEL